MMRANGTHTYSVGTTLTYKGFRKIWDACYRTKCIEDSSNVWNRTKKLYCYAYKEQGLKVYLTRRPGKLYRLRVQIEPCRVLGNSDATALSKMSKAQYTKMVKFADKLLRKLHIPSIDTMKISRCDVTVNLIFDNQAELMEYLRLFKKGLMLPHYRHVYFKKNDGKAKDYKLANAHSHCVSCKSASFLIYDKIAQLEMIGRCDETLVGKHILRLEAELKRPTFKKRLGKNAMATNWGILSAAAKKSQGIVEWYIKRLQPDCEQYLRYEDAAAKINSTNLKQKTRDRMLYLLRKTSDRDSLDAALVDLRKKYGLSKDQCITVLKKFQKLGISPITLRNDSKFESLPYILM